MQRYTGLLGLVVIVAVAYLFSANRRAIQPRVIFWGLGLQFAFAVFVLRVDIGRRIFQYAGDAVNKLLSYAFVGSQFVFGDLGKQGSRLGFYFAFQVLPTVIFIAAFFALHNAEEVFSAALWLAGIGAFLFRRGDTVKAVSSICSDLPCELSWNGGNGVLDCPCHPASFKPDGTPTNKAYSLPSLDLVSVRVTDTGRVEVLGT